MFFEAGDGEVVAFHDREALGGDGTEEGVGVALFGRQGGGAGEGLDEGDQIVRVRGGGVVQAQDVDGHFDVELRRGWIWVSL